MQRMRTSLLPWLTLLMLPVVWAAPPGVGTHNDGTPGGAAPVAAAGAYALHLSVRLPDALPPGASLLCKARAVPNAPALRPLAFPALPVHSGLVTRIGSNANCTVHVPFSWIVSDAASGAVLSYEIDTRTTGGAAVSIRRQEGMRVAYPPSGATASLDFTF